MLYKPKKFKYEFCLHPDRVLLNLSSRIRTKVTHVGQISLPYGDILFFGGIYKYKGIINRNQCYLMNIEKKSISKQDFRLKQPDFFDPEFYMYAVSPCGYFYYIAG
jgi:hypothetical protein